MTRITFKHLVLSGLMAGLASAAMAQPTPTAPAPASIAQSAETGAHKPTRQHDHAPKHAKRAERQNALKEQLKLSASQEQAWAAYTASMQRPAREGVRPDREATRSRTTPERIELMRARQAERLADMNRRADATLNFYATLSPEQQKLFDTRGGWRGEHGQHRHDRRGHPSAPAKG